MKFPPRFPRCLTWTVALATCVLIPRLPAQQNVPTPSASPGSFVTGKEFPIGVWLQSPHNAARYKAAGINLYVGLYNGPTPEQLSALTRAGMRVFCEQNAVGLAAKGDPVIAGWLHGDEPDNSQSLPKDKGGGYGPPISPATIIADYTRLKTADPSRPVMLNLGQGVAWDGWYGRGPRTNHPEDYRQYVKGSDIVSFDIYPATHNKPAVAGKLEYVARGVERLMNWAGPTRQVWSCIECTRISNLQVKPTPAQVRSEVWMAIIRGARGLIYFCHQFEPEFREAALLDDPDMLAAVTAINRQIQELAPVLATPTLVDAVRLPSGSPLAVMAKEQGGIRYVFAVNLTDKPVKGAFTLAGLKLGIAEVQTLGENQAVIGAKPDGAFSDDFAPYGVHLYKVGPK